MCPKRVNVINNKATLLWRPLKIHTNLFRAVNLQPASYKKKTNWLCNKIIQNYSKHSGEKGCAGHIVKYENRKKYDKRLMPFVIIFLKYIGVLISDKGARIEIRKNEPTTNRFLLGGDGIFSDLRSRFGVNSTWYGTQVVPPPNQGPLSL